MNYLSAAKVRQHGISDRRWSLSEKVIQYKGLLKLIKREHNQRKISSQEESKKTQQQLHQLLLAVKSKREHLRSVVNSDRRLVECVLIQNKPLRLACRQLKAQEIIEAVKQLNYSLRRRLDLILYRSNNKQNYLTQLWLELGDLKNSIYFTQEKRHPIELECLRVTGKVQNVNLLKEAAISVYDTYILILFTLKKDRIYYDHLINTLKGDLITQNGCILNLITVGQVSFEEMDDKKTECMRIYAKVDLLNDYQKDLRNGWREVEEIKKSINTLIRKDNDITVFPSDKEQDSKVQNLLIDINVAEQTLLSLQNTLFVSTYEQISKTLISQREINTKLKDLLEQRSSNKQKLLNIVETFTKEYEKLICTSTEIDISYRSIKTESKKNIKTKEQKMDLVLMTKQKRSCLLKDMVNRLQCIERSIKSFTNEPSKEDRMKSLEGKNILGITGENTIQLIQQNLKILVDQKVQEPKNKFEETNMLEAFMNVPKATYMVPDEDNLEESQEAEFEQDDSTVLTRKDIKLASAHIVEMAAANLVEGS